MKVFKSLPDNGDEVHREHGCKATGRYFGGHDEDDLYTSSVLIEERTCGAMLVVISEVARAS